MVLGPGSVGTAGACAPARPVGRSSSRRPHRLHRDPLLCCYRPTVAVGASRDRLLWRRRCERCARGSGAIRRWGSVPTAPRRRQTDGRSADPRIVVECHPDADRIGVTGIAAKHRRATVAAEPFLAAVVSFHTRSRSSPAMIRKVPGAGCVFADAAAPLRRWQRAPRLQPPVSGKSFISIRAFLRRCQSLPRRLRRRRRRHARKGQPAGAGRHAHGTGSGRHFRIALL
jgi:hypothetical protein